jgi:hypothetical protein
VAGLLSAPLRKKPPALPTAPPSENIMPNPIIQKARVEMANTTKFFDRIITAFLLRHRPASSRPKPAFMKNTSAAVTMTQTVSRAILSSACDMGPSFSGTSVWQAIAQGLFHAGFIPVREAGGRQAIRRDGGPSSAMLDGR